MDLAHTQALMDLKLSEISHILKRSMAKFTKGMLDLATVEGKEVDSRVSFQSSHPRHAHNSWFQEAAWLAQSK